VRHYSREQVRTKMSCLLPPTTRFMCSPVRSICWISRRSLRYPSLQVRLLELVYGAYQVPCCRWHQTKSACNAFLEGWHNRTAIYSAELVPHLCRIINNHLGEPTYIHDAHSSSARSRSFIPESTTMSRHGDIQRRVLNSHLGLRGKETSLT
jgi:hypothetical protein